MAENNAFSGLFTLKKAILYLRVSTRKQARRGGGDDEGFSIPAQREAGRKKAAELGAMVVKEFVDRGASAKSADRKDLQAMLKYIDETDVDFVIVHKVDRLARNRGDDSDITRALAQRNVKLVSVSENIDETPSGMLMHGIMATIAEFYSQNLANEVMKGMTGKVENGGTVGRAPIGYLNVRRMDEFGREERYIELDAERAPLVKLAFEKYAGGDWVVSDLADYLASQGLATRATPEIPSKPIDMKGLHKILRNPYYKGMVRFKGKYHPGKHEPLVDEATWQKVQDIISSHINGERMREHPHFLKGMVYCGTCGRRLLIQYAKSRSGIRYPYYSCAGRHSHNKQDGCKQKSVLIEEVERQVENLYEMLSLSQATRKDLEKRLLAEIRKTTDGFKAERREMEKEKEKLQRKQKKLLEAHYDDAIPPDLFKEEQHKLSGAISSIDQRIQLQMENCAEAEERLSTALVLLEDCGKLYAKAPEHIKKAFNIVFFEKIYVHNKGDGVTIAPIFTEAYGLLFGQPSGADTATDAQQEQGAGNGSQLDAGAVPLVPFTPLQYQNHAQSHFFRHGFSKDILVEISGIEPLTS